MSRVRRLPKSVTKNLDAVRPLNHQKRKPGRLLRRTIETALTATAEQIDRYVFDQIDVEILHCLAEGVHVAKDIAARLEISTTALYNRLRDPVRAAWISTQLCKVIPNRVGQVWAVAHSMALRGDISAMKLVLERFDPLFRPTHGSTSHYVQQNIGSITVKNLSDEELAARIQALSRDVGAVQDVEWVEKEKETKNSSNSSPSKQGAPSKTPSDT